MEPTMIFAAVNAGKSIGQFLGLIEGTSCAVNALLHQSFQSAKANLEYARDSTGKNQIDYIKQAKTDFIRANTVEKGKDLITSYLGLAMCQYLLGDITNARKSLEYIKAVQLPQGDRNKAVALDVVLPEFLDFFSPILGPFRRVANRLTGKKGDFELSAERELEEYKSQCIKILDMKQLVDKSNH